MKAFRRESLVTAVLGVFVGVSAIHAADWYVDPSGSDGGGNDGSLLKPWRTISHAVTNASPGDTIHLTAGATFTEDVYIPPGAGGTALAPKVITSDPDNRAVITPTITSERALFVWNSGDLHFENLRFIGQGMDTHNMDGVMLYADNARYHNIQFLNCEFAEFGKTGLVMGGSGNANYGFSNVLISDSTAHDNRRNGIITWGDPWDVATANTNITVRRCAFYRNLGDPAVVDTHTGSGIILGNVTDAVIEHCVAYQNGERCTTTGGPVAIWGWMCTRLVIQYCEAYSNRAVNCDGGGFDLDGGAQDSIIQYCYSHDNDGAGYLICQFTGAGAYLRNTVRYCISENDGRRAGEMGGIHFWSSGANGGIQDTHIYGNTVFSSVSPAVYFQNTNGQYRTKMWNNIFVTTGGKILVKGSPATGVAQFQNNVYWSSGAAFNVGGYASLAAWRTGKSQELLGTLETGYEMDPCLVNPGQGGIIGVTTQLHTLAAYKLQGTSPLIDRGLDLASVFSITPGTQDFFGNAVPQCRGYDIGAYESPDTDGDGMSDDWEMACLGSLTNSTGTTHSDSDEQSDYDEFVAGTNPTNASSCFAVSSFTANTNHSQFVLQWSSAVGRHYAVEKMTNLLDGDMEVLTSNIVATPTLNTYTAAVDSASAQFYRIRVR